MLIFVLKIIVIIVIIIDVILYVNFMLYLYRMGFYNRVIEEMILYRSLCFCSFGFLIGKLLRNLNFLFIYILI